MYSVVVGNIGTVETGRRNECNAAFREYVAQSKRGYGRAAGEEVTMFDNAGEPLRAYTPKPKGAS